MCRSPAHDRAVSTLVSTSPSPPSSSSGRSQTAAAQGTPKKPHLSAARGDCHVSGRVRRPPVKSLGTFHPDGTIRCTDQGDVTADPPSVFRACHGVWKQVEKSSFAYTASGIDLGLERQPGGLPQGARRYTVSVFGRRVFRGFPRRHHPFRRQRSRLGRGRECRRADSARTALFDATRARRRRYRSPSRRNRNSSTAWRPESSPGGPHVLDPDRIRRRERFPDSPVSSRHLDAVHVDGGWPRGLDAGDRIQHLGQRRFIADGRPARQRQKGPAFAARDGKQHPRPPARPRTDGRRCTAPFPARTAPSGAAVAEGRTDFLHVAPRLVVSVPLR